MTEEKRCRQHRVAGGHGHGSHPSSFWMHDPVLVFRELGLKEGNRFLDLGCGPGDYTLEAARIVGESGIVFALDRAYPLIDNLGKWAETLGLSKIRGMVADMTAPLPLGDNLIDVCFLATVLHALNLDMHGKTLFTEIRRVLKPDGRLAVIECKKEHQSFGPPLEMRLSAEEIEEVVEPYGFKKGSLTDLGFNYLIQFSI